MVAWHTADAQLFDVQEDWRTGWFSPTNGRHMEYWNAPIGTLDYPGIGNSNPTPTCGSPVATPGANGGGSPGFYLNNPKAVMLQ